ncbi:MAG TPA: hypothetical protein VLV86_02400 [Vicinamibacterales bacterium]|nr:hypothetical protein [Vicinamibacterales bacterium]
MTWFDVDGAREYLARGASKKPSRKTIYAMVSAGMKVARLGTTGRRLMFSAEWIDEHLQQTASGVQPRTEQPPTSVM